MKVKLAERKVQKVVAEINEILDKNFIFGTQFNKQIIKELIVQNLSKNSTIELMEELEKMPISKWND